ncbi:RAMP superfamily CRISPR-associated protein [Argonema antarcticum]|uniref:RAMP superfamily CRISPR-associated protein n=1 Tax=Argonema antarcticum TaxID=2942763 RepID=UPI0020125B09|nr:RAMP superfamily CRISPR-associated protein [Argonema antarcticum]MCL1473246.1 RAMP superfamily CRISPR-associated protein [Argonema antarcticum A004/B2]
MTKLYRTDHRNIIKRIIVRGTLVLDTPTCLGTGDADSPTDLPLLRDSLDDKYALLTGSSIAGALRNYLREKNKGYGESDRRYDRAVLLFGDLFSYKDEKDKSEPEKIKLREDDTQSPLIIDDAISTKPIQSELRDGVKINSITRTAADKAKYDLELLQAGTEFAVCFELLIDKKEEDKSKQDVYEAELCKGLAIALQGLEPKNGSKSGEICLGMKKRRGFGRCHVKEWQVWNFDLTDASDRMAWLLFDRECTNKLPVVTNKIADALGEVLDEGEDRRDRFLIHATFKLVGSLLIRSGQAATGRAPDVVHLKSYRPDKPNPESVLSGTSLAGVLRHRAERIVKTLGSCSPIVDKLFGYVVGKQSQASRLVVHEKVIEKATELVQNRIAIDRFTGGAYHGALFDEQPIFGGDETCVTIELELRQPKEYEIGLLLLLIKDLWTMDLPVGGESSIGRGRLKGIKADLIRHHPKEPKGWTIAEANGSLQVMNLADPKQSEDLVKDELERFVKALLKELGKEVEV